MAKVEQTVQHTFLIEGGSLQVEFCEDGDTLYIRCPLGNEVEVVSEEIAALRSVLLKASKLLT